MILLLYKKLLVFIEWKDGGERSGGERERHLFIIQSHTVANSLGLRRRDCLLMRMVCTAALTRGSLRWTRQMLCCPAVDGVTLGQFEQSVRKNLHVCSYDGQNVLNVLIVACASHQVMWFYIMFLFFFSTSLPEYFILSCGLKKRFKPANSDIYIFIFM